MVRKCFDRAAPIHVCRVGVVLEPFDEEYATTRGGAPTVWNHRAKFLRHLHGRILTQQNVSETQRPAWIGQVRVSPQSQRTGGQEIFRMRSARRQRDNN